MKKNGGERKGKKPPLETLCMACFVSGEVREEKRKKREKKKKGRKRKGMEKKGEREKRQS